MEASRRTESQDPAERSGEPDRTHYDVPYERMGTLYGRSATVYGRTVTDDPDDEPGFLGFEGIPEPVRGRHSRSARSGPVGRTFESAGLPVVAFVLAVLAILIGGIATVTGIIASGRATSAEVAARRAAGLASSAAAAAAPTVDQFGMPKAVAPGPAPTASPRPTPSPSPTPDPARLDPDRLDPGANYELAYSGQVLRVRPTTCEGTGIDVDDPRVLPATGADAAYRSCPDGFHLDFEEAARFAVVADPQASAGGCVSAIRAAAGVGWVAPVPGTTVCVLTSRLAAEPQRLTTKLVRVNVENLEADGTLVAALSAWVVP